MYILTEADAEFIGCVSVDNPDNACGYGGDCDCDGQDCG